MATVLIYFDEIDEQALPFVCMKCGRTADLWKTKRFDWEKIGKAALRMLGPVPAGPKLYEVTVPLCRAHRNHWLWRGLFAWGVGVPLIAFLLVMVGVIAEGSPALKQSLRGTENILGPLVALDILVLLPLWLIGMFILRFITIRPVKVTNKGITFTGVAQAFKERLEAIRDGGVDVRKAPAACANYRVVGLPVGGASKQLVATFDDQTKAQECVRFLAGAGTFTQLAIEEIDKETTQ